MFHCASNFEMDLCCLVPLSCVFPCHKQVLVRFKIIYLTVYCVDCSESLLSSVPCRIASEPRLNIFESKKVNLVQYMRV